MRDNEPTLAAMRKLRAWRFIIIYFFQFYVCPGDKCALHTNEDCWKHNFNGAVRLAHVSSFLINTTSHNKSQSHHGLIKLQLVSKNLGKRKTKSLSGWKLKCCRSSEKLTIWWETRTKALQVIKHMVWFTTFSQRKIRRSNKIVTAASPVSVHLENGTTVIVP